MQKSMDVGAVVFSRAGRDSGRYFMVIEVVDDNYVSIVDGDVRRLETPKLKKIKHLKNTGETLTTIASKVLANTKIYDAEIYSALRKYNS